MIFGGAQCNMGTTQAKATTNDDSQSEQDQQHAGHSVRQNTSVESFLESESEEGSVDLSEWTSALGVEPMDDKILRERFKILNNGKENQPLHREVFDKEPYCENQFCQWLVNNLLSSSSSSSTKTAAAISSTEFCDAIKGWQKLSDHDKLDTILSMLKTNGHITQDLLWQALHYSLPSCYTEHECKLLAKTMIHTMVPGNVAAGVSSSEYKKWIIKHVAEERLHEALDFKVSKCLN